MDKLKEYFKQWALWMKFDKIIHPMEGINFLNNKGKSIVNINLNA